MYSPAQSTETKVAILEEKNNSLEHCAKVDDRISLMIGELKDENREQHEAVSNRIEKIEIKLDEFVKFRWIIVGIFTLATFAVSQSAVVVDILTPDSSGVTIEKNK